MRGTSHPVASPRIRGVDPLARCRDAPRPIPDQPHFTELVTISKDNPQLAQPVVRQERV
jgi:hypothetical protein